MVDEFFEKSFKLDPELSNLSSPSKVEERRFKSGLAGIAAAPSFSTLAGREASKPVSRLVLVIVALFFEVLRRTALKIGRVVFLPEFLSAKFIIF